MSLAAAIYNLLLLLAMPAAALFVWARYVRTGRSRLGWNERFGHLPADLIALCAGREVIWVHAASVGETMAAKPLVALLRQQRPEAVVLLSGMTDTGRAIAEQAGADGVFFLPVDLPWVIDRVIRAVRPRLLCLIDTELWPNLLWRCKVHGVRVVLANGRIGERAFARANRPAARWVYRWALSHADRLLMQSTADAERIRALGARQTSIMGNLKGDESFPAVDDARLAHWQAELGLAPDQPVLLAGSTGPGEEAILLDAFAAVRARHPGARLVLVPRAVDRAGEIADLATAAGLTAVRRSALPAQAARSLAERAVIIVDTIGELAELFAVGTVCFVGRSLVKMGGSNVLQAAAQARPVLTGPYVSNVRDSVALLTEVQAAVTVSDAEQIAAQTSAWLDQPELAAAAGRRGRDTVLASRGATQRCVDVLLELLDAGHA
ncbi:MAG: 3-deoxy-D-manno-octulosonic acid transferase [Armatimonadetes bacterium]|nr:3-deoxy-D-manno-octulosonic acid transferase [Armatimonadota bacterium]